MANVSNFYRDVLGIDPDDPDREEIGLVLAQMRLQFGFDPADPNVLERATAVARRRVAAAAARQGAMPPPRSSLVYYLRIGRLIKVGMTTNLPNRLRHYPPDATLLATEPGGRPVELARHRQFHADLDARAEWFRPSVALLTHINALREQPLTAAELAA